MRLHWNSLFANTRLSARVVNPSHRYRYLYMCCDPNQDGSYTPILKMIKTYISEDPSNYFCMYSGKTIKFDKVLLKCRYMRLCELRIIFCLLKIPN